MKLHTRILACGLLLAAPTSAAPDVLVMKDGRIFNQFKLEQKETFVEVTLKAGKIEVGNDLVDVVLKEGEEITFVPETEEEKEKFADGWVPFNGDWTKISKAKRAIEKELKDRLKEAESDLEHAVWRSKYETESKYFMWHHTLGMRPASRFIESADAYYKIFQKDWKFKRDKGKPKLTICFYKDESQYMKVGAGPPGALAYFMIKPPYDLNLWYDRLDRDFTEQVLFHELGHYLHKLIDEKFDYPHWPGESVCEYYGGAAFDQKTGKLEVGLIHNGRLATIKSQMESGDKYELEKMIQTRGFEDYTWGWSFVHFLMNDKTHKKNFVKFFGGLARDKDVKRVPYGPTTRTVKGEEVLRYFMDTMKIEDLDALRDLQEEWYEYINTELQFTGDGAMLWEAKTANSTGDRKLATELYEKALKADFEGAPANAHYDYFRLLRDKSGAEAIKQLEAAVRKAPLTAEYRYKLGEILREKKGKKAELGEFHHGVAIELNPDIERETITISFDD